MLKKLMCAATVCVLFPTIALAATSAQDFVSKAAVSNMFEIESSKLALKNASNADVKAFAQQMIDDHTKAGDELKSTLAAAGNIQMPQALDAAHKTSLDSLAGKSGAAFDDAYVADQKKAHDEAVALFTEYSTSGDNPQLKGFAGKTLPVLKMHQQHAQKLGASADTTSSSRQPTSAEPTLQEGANSFTEGQARDRLSAAGYASIQGLAKDDKGIWRGNATKNGKSVSVGLDYKGNIVAQ
ncbi:DUF4142 domain-containing protein [Labrys sp. LIt4]|uniref:DUF4142 domain-containing protein n=1 Tax=Labrys sp. LIt4 TaxID=2821355 RepID=UPI001FD73976|nr:DUF4142 domain-containing protein [Labrys sp. LIt4]